MTSINDLTKINEKISALEEEKKNFVRKIEQQKSDLEKTLENELRRLATSLGYSLVKTGASTKKGAKKRQPAAVKYRDDSGNTWTGRGMTPRWLVAAERAGKNREGFRV